MPSADQFLRLLEEKDLVSAQVLQAARREMQRSSPPPDAVSMSLWLVQGQHITASQAERLLAAVTDEAAGSSVTGSSAISRWQKGPPKPTEVLKVPLPSPPEAPRPAAPRSAAAKASPSPDTSLDDLGLAPLNDEPGGSSKTTAKPAVQASAAKASPAAAAPAASAPPAAKSGGKAKPAIGGELESLGTSMKGPLDSLIESESIEASPFDDPMGGGSLTAAAPKKFKLRRFIKNLFRRSRSKTVTVKAADPKQVKIVLFSWGVGVLALLAVLAAAWFLSPGDAPEILRKASAAFDNQDYAQAIEQYNKYLKSYPKGTQADDVRVNCVLAKLRQAIQQANKSGNWSSAFDVAQAQVKALPKSPSSELMQKVGVAWAEIGEGLAKQTQAKPDKDRVNRLLAITDTIEKNVPVNLRPAEMLEEINHIASQSRQVVEGRLQVETAVKDIQSAVSSGSAADGYVAYRNLVQLFPDLVDDPAVTESMKQVSALEQAAVKLVDQPLEVAHAERPSDLVAAMPLAVQPLRGELAAAQGKLRFVVAQGTAYGLNAATGKVLWRRFVAFDPKLPVVTAVPIVDASQNDVVLSDPVHQEVLRVNGQTGELVWRVSAGGPNAAAPVRAGRSLLLLTQDQRLHFIDLATGESPKYLQLPQAVRLPPVVDAAHGLIYLVAEQSNLYVLAHGECQQVLHLGHEPGTIAAVPAVAGDFLLVPVNDNATEATVRVLSIAKEDQPLQSVQRIKLKGFLNTAPAATANGAIVVTAQGGMLALEHDASNSKLPFRVAARVDTALEEKAVHFVVSDGRSFWVTGGQLTRYTVQADEGQIATQAATDQGANFAVPPEIDGGTMFTAAERSKVPGMTVSAIDLAKNEPVWQTWLGAPLAATPEVGPVTGKLTAVTASGGMFRFPPAGLHAKAAPAEPVLSVGSARLTKPLSSVLALPGELYALTSGADTKEIAIYDPQEQDRQFRWLVCPRELAAAPGAFARGLLSPCVNGPVYLLDPLARLDMLAKPYAPSVTGVNVWDWRTPQAVDDKLAVLCDGDRRMVAVQLAAGDEPALTEAAVAISKRQLVSPIAVLGKSVFVVDATDALLNFQLPGLSPGKPQNLGGHWAWGPHRAGKLVLVANDKNQLLAVNEDQQVAWQANLSYGPLVGTPLLVGGDIYLAAKSGVISRISAADGKEQGKADAGCPLGTGPLLIGTRLIVGGHDGSLLEVKRP